MEFEKREHYIQGMRFQSYAPINYKKEKKLMLLALLIFIAYHLVIWTKKHYRTL